MARTFNSRKNQSVSTHSEESALDLERNICCHPNFRSSSPPPLQALASGAQHSESNAAHFSWPTFRLNASAEDRVNYFANLQKGVLPKTLDRLPPGQRANSLLEVMTIRAFHSKILRRYSLGTAIGFRIRKGTLTDIPAILVFVARKVHRRWLSPIQCLPSALEGPGGVWCDVDVVEFSYYGAPAPTPKEQLYSDLVDGLRGSDPCIGSGSQVANQETYGTLGAIVKSRSGSRQVGFLTNRHVAVDLDYPNQKMFHPLPPNLGPGVYLGAVERATSFITDDLWYGIFAGTNPGVVARPNPTWVEYTTCHMLVKLYCTSIFCDIWGKFGMLAETFVRADGAFIPFTDDFDVSNVTTLVKGVGEIGEVMVIDLQSEMNSLIGRQVVKVGRSSGLTTGTVMAYALEYNDEKGICFFTDFLVVGENQQTFDLEGDSGSLILLTGKEGEKPRPIGIIWGGTANRGRLKLKSGQGPENWTSGVDLGRLLDLLELDLITTSQGLQESIQEQRSASAAAVGSTVGESSPAEPALLKDKIEEIFEPLGINIEQFPLEDRAETITSMEHQFIPSFGSKSPIRHLDQEANPESKSLSALRNSSDGDLSVCLQLGEPEPKRQRCNPTSSLEESK
ncbi:Protein NARROW LEAF 1 [Asimina triloba]